MLTTTLWDRFNFFWFLGSVVRDTFGFQKSFKVKKKTKVAVCVSKNTSGGGRTHDLPLRRRMPYPFGHGGGICLFKGLVLVCRIRTSDRRNIIWALRYPLQSRALPTELRRGLAEDGFDPSTFGLWAQRASPAPLCFIHI